MVSDIPMVSSTFSICHKVAFSVCSGHAGYPGAGRMP
ncbi:Uncharacterised protein [Vibrio cholerae]|nr:Uncharacterised protein [Vibrio cholerae]